MALKSTRFVTALALVCLFISCAGNREEATAPPTPNPTSTPTPTPKPTPHPASLDALKSLRKMSGAVEIGINFQEYSSRMIDLKSEVDESLAQLPKGELKKEITLALQAYVDAKTIWNDAASSDYVFTMLEPAKTLQHKYRIPEASKGQMTYKKVALSTIWAAADRHIGRASKLLTEEP